MDDDKGFTFETEAKILECMGRLTSDLIFCYPSEIERQLTIFKNYVGEKRSLSQFIINKLVEEAKDILRASSNPTEIEKLKSLKDYDPLMGEDGNASIQVLSAKQILFSAKKLKDHIKKSQTEDAVIETVRLLSAAICCNAEYVTWRGIRAIVAVEKKKPKRELEGIQKAIAIVIKNGNGRNPERLAKYFFRNHGEKNPLEVDDYEVFVEKDNTGLDHHYVCQRLIGTEKTKRITWKTFLGANYYHRVKKDINSFTVTE